MEKRVKLSDVKVGEKTISLYNRLQSCTEHGQVIFGHQNDVHKHVSDMDGVYSDTELMTGHISGIVGMDSLSLAGNEIVDGDVSICGRVHVGTEIIYGTRVKQHPVEQAVQIGRSAVEKGAVLSLSMHIPNPRSNHIRLYMNGQNGECYYDFTDCDFMDCKLKGEDCATKCLPGGELHDIYVAYLELVVEFARELSDVPILFRPFHECNGGWFWWGTDVKDEELIELFRYTVSYLRDIKNLHNLIYVYSPNGPVTSKKEYLSRYPGDDCIDILAIDYYADYLKKPVEGSRGFFEGLADTCRIIRELADEKGKLCAIAETGIRVEREDGSVEGLLLADNPAAGDNWYVRVLELAKEYGMCYLLLWHNFAEDNFYVPFRKKDGWAHEMSEEFMRFYRHEASVFAGE